MVTPGSSWYNLRDDINKLPLQTSSCSFYTTHKSQTHHWRWWKFKEGKDTKEEPLQATRNYTMIRGQAWWTLFYSLMLVNVSAFVPVTSMEWNIRNLLAMTSFLQILDNVLKEFLIELMWQFRLAWHNGWMDGWHGWESKHQLCSWSLSPCSSLMPAGTFENAHFVIKASQLNLVTKDNIHFK